jgi:CheY-like chemotaxis protein
LGIIDQESTHLLNIINNILDFSKIEAGELEIEQISFDFRNLMDEVGERIALYAAQKALELNVFISPELPRRLVGDPTRLRQVLLNLAADAIKFTHEGEICIKVKLVEHTTQNVIVRFSVEDTGIGIAREKHPAILDSVEQIDGSTTRKYGDTGLGTTISKQLAELMGGRINLHSQAGEGMRIEFSLVFDLPADQETGWFKETGDWQNLKVLVVDDCATSRKIAGKYLETLGCRVTEAKDGFEAIEILKTKQPAGSQWGLMITDFRMPNMSGYELARQVRAMSVYRQLPIIAVSGLLELVDGNDAQASGFDRCLVKPLKIDDLIMAMKALCCCGRSEHSGCDYRTGRSDGVRLDKSQGRILLVEHYITNQQVVNMHLTSLGFQVDIAENGQAALEKFSSNSYDLILMDLEMPGMDGLTASQEIRRMERLQSGALQSIPIIALTAHALKGEEEKCRRVGMTDYMTKPIRRKLLLAKVRHWLSAPDPSFKAAPASEIDDQCALPDSASIDTPMNREQALNEFMSNEEI